MLKNCPCCESEEVVEVKKEDFWFVICDNCGLAADGEDTYPQRNPVEVWNQRPSNPKELEEIANWHLDQALQWERVAKFEASDKAEPVRSMLMERSKMHRGFYETLRELGDRKTN